MSTISERVARGAAWLDQKQPGWWRTHHIDLKTLDLSRPCFCVVGQLAPEKEFGAAIDAGWFDLNFADAFHFGFTAVAPNRVTSGWDDIYRQLDAEWRRVITERRAAA